MCASVWVCVCLLCMCDISQRLTFFPARIFFLVVSIIILLIIIHKKVDMIYLRISENSFRINKNGRCVYYTCICISHIFRYKTIYRLFFFKYNIYVYICYILIHLCTFIYIVDIYFCYIFICCCCFKYTHSHLIVFVSVCVCVWCRKYLLDDYRDLFSRLGG